MKTRTLLLLSLACGAAIMLAGAVFLVQLAGQDDAAPPVGVGAVARVGDMQIVVVDADERSGRLEVAIEIGGTADDDPSDEFRLIAGARPVAVASSTCAASDDSTQSCTVTFDVAGIDGVSRVLFYERGDDQARWVLA